VGGMVTSPSPLQNPVSAPGFTMIKGIYCDTGTGTLE